MPFYVTKKPCSQVGLEQGFFSYLQILNLKPGMLPLVFFKDDVVVIQFELMLVFKLLLGQDLA